jgi:hypothetical protein
MNRLLSFFLTAVLAVAAAACGSTKPPAPAVIQGSHVISSLKDLSSMYEKKNLQGFMLLISDSFKERKELSAGIQSVFSRYESVQFTVHYTKMFITVDEKNMSKATFNWDSTWETQGRSTVRNSGRVTFVFEPKGGKLASIDGKNPFVPQTRETPKQ